MAWGAGLLGGPAVAGFIFERFGFARLTILWSALLLVVSVVLSRVQSAVRLLPATGDSANIETADTDSDKVRL
jgi:hypothetical protein